MLNFQRIICMWICCVSCMFGTTQLSTSLVQAVPYEYFDDHDQSFYDLDTEQIQAKYDTRLLSQQMLPTETQKGYQNSAAGIAFNVDSGDHRNVLEGRKQNNVDSLYKSTAKLKSNDDGSIAFADVDWLEQEEETATKAASSTSTFADTLDELHLPRAASCFTNGRKYTHGQKVPRLDNCEVCLCMDGEIFCWWEKCDKKSAKTSLTYDDFSTPFEESSTTRMQLNPKTTFKTTLKPMKKPKTTNEDYKYDDDDSAEIHEMQEEYEGLKEQLLQGEHDYEQESVDTHTKKLDRKRNKQMVKKKTYQKQEEGKHTKKMKEQNQNWKQQQQQQPKQLKSNEHYEQYHRAHNHNNNNNNNNNNNRHHDNGSSSSKSKILNFPENLPSVLYYDYKTEEHHQHQHQHREQHLKHQKQKQQQHEKELKQRHQKQQQQQKKLLQQQQQQQQQYNHNNRHHEYGQDFHTYNSPEGMELEMVANIVDGRPLTTFKYFSSGNENIYNEDLQTDSDILPEPPTKKPKLLTSMSSVKTTGTPLAQLNPVSTAAATAATEATEKISTIPKEELTKSATILTSSIPLKKQILTSWNSDKKQNDKTNDNSHNQSKINNKSTEDIMDTEDQDEAFHRWLTSTEMNNKNNFTLNETVSREEGNANVVGRGLYGSNSDYNVDERIYENIGFDTDAGFSSTIGNTKQTITAMTTGSTKNTEPVNGMYKNEQNFKDNRQNGNSNGIINYNPPFSQTYENYENNNNQLGISNAAAGDDDVISSTTSNEDNGVASVVNIDIMLTASSAETQQQKLKFQTINQQQQQQQQQLEQQLQNFEHEKQIAKSNEKFLQTSHLISKTNNAAAATSPAKDIRNNNQLPFLQNDNNISKYNNNNKNSTSIVDSNPNIEIQNMGVNLLNNNNSSSSSSNTNSNNNIATSYSSSSISDKFKLKNSPTLLVSLTNATSTTASTAAIALVTASTTPPTLSTTPSPERQCNVMGTLYKIGDVLPQDTGNCLQCICIDGSTSDDTPRVTCSPHNCPPLVLPDLFDATGY